MKKIFYSFIPIFILSCASQHTETSEVQIDIDPNTAEGFVSCDDILDTTQYTLIPLDNTEKAIIDVSKLQITNNRIYILDENTHCLHIFRHDGKTLFSIDKQGKAGNEYLDITDFHATQEEIYLLDQDSKKILIYDTLGHFKKKINIDNYWANGIYVENNECYLINNNSYPKAGSYHIFQLSPDGIEINKFLHFDIPSGISSKKNYSIGENNEFLYCQTPINTVYKTTSNRCIPILDINFGSYNLPEKYHTLNLRTMIREKYTLHYVLGIDKIFSNKKYIFLQYRYKEEPYWIIYDRELQTVKKHCRGFGPNKMYQIGFSDFVVQDKWIYEIRSAFDFKKDLKYYTPEPSLTPRCQKELEEVNRHITETSNPILIRYKLK